MSKNLLSLSPLILCSSFRAIQRHAWYFSLWISGLQSSPSFLALYFLFFRQLWSLLITHNGDKRLSFRIEERVQQELMRSTTTATKVHLRQTGCKHCFAPPWHTQSRSAFDWTYFAFVFAFEFYISFLLLRAHAHTSSATSMLDFFSLRLFHLFFTCVFTLPSVLFFISFENDGFLADFLVLASRNFLFSFLTPLPLPLRVDVPIEVCPIVPRKTFSRREHKKQRANE